MPIDSDSAVRGMATLVALLALSACTTLGDEPGGSVSGGQSGTATAHGAPPAQMNPEKMNMDQMCAMHRNMHKAPAEQHQAMMEEKMKGMSPEMRQRHMEMMRQHCQ